MIIRDGRHGIQHFTEYESISEMLDTVKLHPSNQNHQTACIFSTTARDTPFDRAWRGGISTLTEFRDFINRGWPEGLKRMQDVIVQLKDIPAVKDIRRIGEWADQGDDLNIEKVYSGDIDSAWRRTKRVLKPGASIHGRIFINVSTSCYVRPEEFFWRGATAITAADLLEDAGYRVEIAGFNDTAYTWDRSASRDSFVLVYLKRFDEELDMERLAAITAHASFLRIAIFAHQLSCSSKAHSGLGMPMHNIYPLSTDNDITIDSVFSLEAAIQCVRMIVTKLSGNTFENN